MAIKGVVCVLGRVGMDAHLECMKRADHPCMYTPDTLMAMTDSNKERVSSGVKFSPSSLQGCQRQGTLQGTHDWYLDVDNSWPLFRGNLAHALYETLPPWPGIIGTVREYRFSTQIETKHGLQTVMGKPDLVVLKGFDEAGLHIAVVDYKSKSKIDHDLIAADPKHINQVNIYAWIVARELRNVLGDTAVGEVVQTNSILELGDLNQWMLSGYPVVIDELEIVYLDMTKCRRFVSNVTLTTKGKMTKRSYPREYETLELEPIPVKEAKRVENWLRIRIERQLNNDASGQLPAPLTGDDCWVCFNCNVRSTCVELGLAEGYDMEGQTGAKY
jgi:PD-(D/E)XK nuclease superfamily protein